MHYTDILDVNKKNVQNARKYSLAIIDKDMTVAEVIRALHEQRITVEAEEYFYTLQQIGEEAEDEEPVIDAFPALFKAFEAHIAPEPPRKFSADHPLRLYRSENEAMYDFFDDGVHMLRYDYDAEAWQTYAKKAQTYKMHLHRKQNQLYPHLSDKGISGPLRIFWSYDDDVKNALTEFEKAAKDGNQLAVQSAFYAVYDATVFLMRAEEKLLYPSAFKLLTLNEFIKMEVGDEEIGYAFIEPPVHNQAERQMMRGLDFLMLHHDGSDLSGDTIINLATGRMSLMHLNLMLSHLPFDLTFIDENNLVRYYNARANRLFPRSTGVIGRDVKNCHPRESLNKVQALIDELRTGQRPYADFWFRRDDKMLLIRYIAVRDKADAFRGIVEVAMDIAPFAAIEGEQRLLPES